MSVKVIFLDIDGVLNNNQSDRVIIKAESGRHVVSPTRVKILNCLIRESGAKLVVTSTWRLGETIESMTQILHDIGVVDFKIIGITPNLPETYTLRGNEILAWVKENVSLLGVKHYYEFKSYVILDDDSDMLYWQKNNFIHVDPEIGLSVRDICRACNIFGIPTPSRIG